MMNTTMMNMKVMMMATRLFYVVKSNLLARMCLNLKSTCAGDMMHLIEANIFQFISIIESQ